MDKYFKVKKVSIFSDPKKINNLVYCRCTHHTLDIKAFKYQRQYTLITQISTFSETGHPSLSSPTPTKYSRYILAKNSCEIKQYKKKQLAYISGELGLSCRALFLDIWEEHVHLSHGLYSSNSQELAFLGDHVFPIKRK